MTRTSRISAAAGFPFPPSGQTVLPPSERPFARRVRPPAPPLPHTPLHPLSQLPSPQAPRCLASSSAQHIPHGVMAPSRTSNRVPIPTHRRRPKGQGANGKWQTNAHRRAQRCARTGARARARLSWELGGGEAAAIEIGRRTEPNTGGIPGGFYGRPPAFYIIKKTRGRLGIRAGIPALLVVWAYQKC